MAKAAPEELLQAAALVQQSHDALATLNHLLVHAEPGTTLDCAQLASLTLRIQEHLYGAVDELNPLVGVEHAA